MTYITINLFAERAALGDRKEMRRGIKRRWTPDEMSVLMKKFKEFLSGNITRLSQNRIEEVQENLLPQRTAAQIRTKLSNIKLGKCNKEK